METIKIYQHRKRKELHEGYFEVPYTLYRDGVAFAKGAEDFSAERYVRGLVQIFYESRETIGRINKGGGVMREVFDEINVKAAKTQEKEARKLVIAQLKATGAGRDIRIVKLF